MLQEAPSSSSQRYSNRFQGAANQVLYTSNRVLSIVQKCILAVSDTSIIIRNILVRMNQEGSFQEGVTEDGAMVNFGNGALTRGICESSTESN